MTIAAISTPVGVGGVSVIRISGEDAIRIAEELFAPASGKAVSELAPGMLTFGRIYEPNRADEYAKVIDEAMLVINRAPRSYTGEDTAELHCHGGLHLTRRVLANVLNAGAVMANAGEFTKRAFANGKIDLVKAEAIIDLINAENDTQVDIAINQAAGVLSERINAIRKRLLHIAATILATIDYPEEGLEEYSPQQVLADVSIIHGEIFELLRTADNGIIARNGVNVAIVGAPNSGKSSLMNRILGQERAIVSHIAGTTRDTIDARAMINGITVNLIDTAGIRHTSDTIEHIGITRSIKAMSESDLILLCVDGSKEMDETDAEVVKAAAATGKRTITVLTKADLPTVLTERFNNDTVRVSAESDIGFTELYELIQSYYHFNYTGGQPIISNQRHKNALTTANRYLAGVIDGLRKGLAVDFIIDELQYGILSLGEVTGASVSYEIVSEIFSNFCVGK